MFTNHSTLTYLVNKSLLGGNVFRWIFLFQEHDFKIIVKIGRLNVGRDHPSRIENGEECTNIEEGQPDVKLFIVRVYDDHFIDIILFLATSIAPLEYTSEQEKELVVQYTNFSLITGQLYKMGLDEILSRYVLQYERHSILAEAHGGVTRGHCVGKPTP